jgi:hypothetical protein
MRVAVMRAGRCGAVGLFVQLPCRQRCLSCGTARMYARHRQPPTSANPDALFNRDWRDETRRAVGQ